MKLRKSKTWKNEVRSFAFPTISYEVYEASLLENDDENDEQSSFFFSVFLKTPFYSG